MQSRILLCLIVMVLFSCTKEPTGEKAMKAEAEIKNILFQNLELKDLSSFEETTSNWQIVGNVVVDQTKKATFETTSGSGILYNANDQEKNKNIFTSFEHGDIEIELDVMMPVGSNSGLYFQGRYEVQLFDSWGVKEPHYSDMGGIYQRWDDARGKGKEGYEGHSPLINAAKAPGLWQHYKIIFHAPKFDDAGIKIKNAWFEEVRLNGVLLHENVEVTGSTRAAAFGDEKPYAPFMIQGDHGAVAFRNITYKLYEDRKIGFESLDLKKFKSTSRKISSLDSLEVESEVKTDSISPITNVDRNGKTVLNYSGIFEIPASGEYLFDMKVNGGALLLIDNDTVINMNGNYNFGDKKFRMINLESGKVPFQLIYNKHTPWKRGFDLYVEGPKMQRYSIQEPSTAVLNPNKIKSITLDVSDKPIVQRSFLMHEGVKRTHCVSVGLPKGINYSYDLEKGTILQVWGGNFMDATQMWHSRGERQVGEPRGFEVETHGDPEFLFLKNKKSSWSESYPENVVFKQFGYEFNELEIPIFSNQINSTTITNRMERSDSEKRNLKRLITVDGDKEIWHKLGDGKSIEELPDQRYLIDDGSYFIDFTGNDRLEPIIRTIDGKKELIVKIPSGKQSINYSIIW